MKRVVLLMTGAALLATPALAQVRPDNCRPVFPLTDPVAAVLPQDVIAQPAVAEARRRFLGLPFLLPGLLGVGGLTALLVDDDDGDDEPVSPV